MMNPFHVASASAAPLGITLVRVSPGAMWIAHALLELLIYTLAGKVRYFRGIGDPGCVARPAAPQLLLRPRRLREH